MARVCSAGSSPRVRGTPTASRVNTLIGRFIPACAGNTAMASTPSATRTVHPRVCGEHGAAAVHAYPRRRFIPACAGNTPNICSGVSLATVHPRVCGEHHSVRPPLDDLHGSSPRVRGTRHLGRAPATMNRFIPACAGNTTRATHAKPTRPVHPRVCGEHDCTVRIVDWSTGSSPRVRGTQEARAKRTQERRFIPACAGNTCRLLGASAGNSGSSPRVRGTRRHRRGAAGGRPVHPRVCGEHSSASLPCALTTGSSPRVRGTRRAS